MNHPPTIEGTAHTSQHQTAPKKRKARLPHLPNIGRLGNLVPKNRKAVGLVALALAGATHGIAAEWNNHNIDKPKNAESDNIQKAWRYGASCLKGVTILQAGSRIYDVPKRADSRIPFTHGTLHMVVPKGQELRITGGRWQDRKTPIGWQAFTMERPDQLPNVNNSDFVNSGDFAKGELWADVNGLGLQRKATGYVYGSDDNLAGNPRVEHSMIGDQTAYSQTCGLGKMNGAVVANGHNAAWGSLEAAGTYKDLAGAG